MAKRFGAIRGRGEGLMGECYGIPTKDAELRVLPLASIASAVSRFLQFARDHGEYQFLVTKVGCGEAGYTPTKIGPLFAGHPDNVILPKAFFDVLSFT